MNWFMNRNVGTKQILAFGTILVLIAFLGLFSLLKLYAVRASTVDMSDRRVPAIQSLSEMQSGFMQYRVSEMSYVFLNDPDERELRMANMESGMSTATKAEAEFESFIDTPDEKKALDAIKQDVDQYKSETQTVMGFTKKNDTADATSEVLGSAGGAFSQLMSDVQAEIDLKVQGAAEAKKANAILYTKSVWWILGTMLTATFLSVLMAIVTTRLIARPVRDAGEVVRRIAAGDITSEDLSVRSSDEIGELANNVNIMQRSLREMIASIFNCAEKFSFASMEFSTNYGQITIDAADLAKQANVASKTTENLKRHLQTVAVGTGEMTSTIQDISKNAIESARVASDAVTMAQDRKAVF
jgi:methyl-accepting chemotaxis protein